MKVGHCKLGLTEVSMEWLFKKRCPGIIWQTSDRELAHRKTISSWIEYGDLIKEMPQSIEIDVEKNSLDNSIEIRSFFIRNRLYKYDSCSTVALY